MTNMDTSEKIGLIIANCNFCVLYHPVRIEIDPDVLPFKLPDKRVVIPIGPATDPKLFGNRIKEGFGNLNGVILVPGRRFDKFGGRHGKGWGWYDRFLSTAPAKIVRIGICSKDQFCESRLLLQEWDQLMDWIIVYDNEDFTFYETSARVVVESSIYN